MMVLPSGLHSSQDGSDIVDDRWRLPSWEQGSFDKLAARTPAYLQLHWPSWNKRTACEAQERNASVHVMGTSGNGDCVYWTEAKRPEQARWECLNDGSCVRSSSARAVFASESQCQAECGRSWECMRPTANVSHEVAYCLPSSPATAAAAPGPKTKPSPGQRFPSAAAW